MQSLRLNILENELHVLNSSLLHSVRNWNEVELALIKIKEAFMSRLQPILDSLFGTPVHQEHLQNPQQPIVWKNSLRVCLFAQ